jgi:hypothetical protein
MLGRGHAGRERVALGLELDGTGGPGGGGSAGLGQLVLLLLEPHAELGELTADALGLAASLLPDRDLAGELVLAGSESCLRLRELSGEALCGDVAEAALDEQLTERAPRSACRFHFSPCRHVPVTVSNSWPQACAERRHVCRSRYRPDPSLT